MAAIQKTNSLGFLEYFEEPPENSS